MKRTSQFKILVTAGLVTLLCSFAVAETYYVSLKGDDANKGMTEKAAFRTIKKGVSVLKAGDTLVIKSGDYGAEQIKVAASGKKGAPVTIKADEPGKVILTGSGGGNGMLIRGKDYVVVDGIRFTNFGAGLAVKLSAYITVKNCIFHNNKTFGIYLYGGSPDRSHHLIFSGNQFLDYADSGPGSPTSGKGISDYGIALYRARNVKVINNYFYGHHHQCLSFKSRMHDSIAAGNVFDGFYYTAIYLGQNTDTKKYGSMRCKNLIAEGNIFRPSRKYRAKSAVIVSNVTGAVVRDNFIDSIYGEDDRSEWFFLGSAIQVLPPSVDVGIYRNTIINARKAALIAHADCEIYNNTIAGCDIGLAVADGVKAMVGNNIFYKNKVQVTKAEPLVPNRVKILTGVVKDGVMTTLRRDPSKKPVYQHNNWFPRWSGMGKTGISVDPGFVGPFQPFKPVDGPTPIFVPDFKRMQAYRLKKTSPCIDRGFKTDLPFIGKAADIGAFEFGAKPKK